MLDAIAKISHLLDEAFKVYMQDLIKEIRQENPNSESELLTTEEAMIFLKISRSTLQNYRDEGLIHYKLGSKTIVYMKKELLEFVKKYKVGS